MMATYTIYVPPHAGVSARDRGGRFRSHPETFSLTVKNIGRKKISSMTLLSETLLTPQGRATTL